MLKLRQIQHLLALAEEAHFARAAARCHLSQPAFSRSIQALEAETRLRLFDRETGDARPTPAGEFLIARARQLVFDARSLERDLQFFRDGALGDTAFGVGPFPAATLLAEVAVRSRSAHPAVNLRVEVGNWQQLEARLVAERIEFFVAHTREVAASDKLEIEPLMRQRAGFWVRNDHPIPSGPVRLRDVWPYGVAATFFPLHGRELLAQLLGLESVGALNIALECDDILTLHELALRSGTVVITTNHAVRRCGLANLLRPLEIIDFPPAEVEIGIVRLRRRTLSPMAQQLQVTFREAAAALG